jgi:catecholate siderophore receptor
MIISTTDSLMQANEPAGALPSLRLSRHRAAGTAMGMALANGAGLHAAFAQAYGTPIDLPPVSVEGAQGGQGGYQVGLPANSKLTQPLVSTPQSVIEVPRKLLDDQGVTTMRDALRNVPGVSLAAGEGSQQGDNLSIRGFNAQNDFFLDGMRDFGSYYRDPFNLQDIEIVQGPASVLFGRGSTGGSVNQVSKQPVLAPITQGSASLGTDGTRRITTDVNRAIEGLAGSAIRLNLMVNENGTAGRDGAENRRLGFAPSIALGLGTPTRFNFDYYHIQANDTPDYGIPWLNGSPAPVAHKNFYGSRDNDFFRTGVDIFTAKVEHDFTDNITVSNQLRYGSYQRNLHVTEPLILNQGPGRDFVFPGTPLNSIVVSRNIIALKSLETIIDNQTNANVGLDTGPFHHAVTMGIELSRQTSDPTRFTYPQFTTNLLDPTDGSGAFLQKTVSTIAKTHTDNVGAYIVDTMAIAPQWDILGGIRFDQFNTKFDQTGTTVAHVSRNDGLPSYNAALVYKPLSNASVYYRYGTSFNPSGESLSLSVATASVAPEKTTTHEFGGKWDVLDQRLSLTGSIYQIQKANAREVDPNNPTLDILAGNYRVRGAQLGVAGHVTERWEIFGGYAYNDAVVVSSPNPQEVGHAPPNAPKHTMTLFSSYKLPWHDLELGGGVAYVSSRTAASTPVAGTNVIERAPGYFTMSLMAKYPVTPNISLQANVTNVTDTYYYDQLHPSHIILGPSRAALFTVNVKL